MILQEVAQYSDVLEASLQGVVGLSQPGGAGVTGELESLDDGVVPWEIEDRVQCAGTLELRREGNIVSKDFTDAENATPAQKGPQKSLFTCLAASIRRPSIEYSLTRSSIQFPYWDCTSGSCVFRSGRATFWSPNQQFISLVLFPHSMGQ